MMDAPVVVIVVFLLQVSISESLLIVQTTQPDPVVHVGSEVLLQCSFTVTSGAIDVKQLTVTWIQYALTVAKYDQEDLIERPRLSLNAEGMKSGNASLLIRSVHFDDGGQYRCIVQHKRKEGDVDIYVSVRATPQVSIKLETNLSLSEGVVTCEAVSFYPRAISFNITRKGETLKTERLTSDQSPSRWRLPDGSFSARSVYTFDASDIRNSRDTMSCEVTHASVDQPITVSTKPGVPVVSLVGTAVLLHASQVVCCAKNFYPSKVVFTWRRSEEVIKSETPQASRTPTGTFTAESSLEFIPDSREPVSCQVEHMTGASERKYVTNACDSGRLAAQLMDVLRKVEALASESTKEQAVEDMCRRCREQLDSLRSAITGFWPELGTQLNKWNSAGVRSTLVE
ncbi:butyrophilin subfamily 1 member A1-like isoform X1 [Erpetoichthys calabaricus]|uniref:butyrophilin subfamily 1 member A1-like isoform X1 n=1 Tax=Erpetoichthys calabaricus TaxID=27687 RepID=UPI00223407AC|nr:butyrophilin subfamily 1 member A1-like isoform X1 [Erpetoichthys calabaricus]